MATLSFSTVAFWNKAVSNKWKKKIFKSFPRKGIDLEWPTYDWTTYPYDNQKKQFSERWHEDGY